MISYRKLFLLLALFAFLLTSPLMALQSRKKTSSKKTTTSTRTSRSKKTSRKKKVVRKRHNGRPRSYVPPVRVSEKVRSSAIQFVRKQVSDPSADWIEQAEALDSFFSQLYALERSSSLRTVHALHFGDSHTAADEFTGQMRSLLQQKFGNGGAGYSFAGYPFAGCRIYGTKREQSSGWTTIGNHFREPNDGLLGLGGLAIETSRAGERIGFDAPFTYGELEYLQRPEGGDVSIYQDSRLIATVSTKGESGPGYYAFDSPDGDHHVEVVTMTDSPVRLLGVVADRNSGVTYEAIGINGAEAAQILKWDEEMQKAYFQRRSPSLIVLDYGTNEASNRSWTYDAYSEMFRGLIGRLRRAVPDAAILVLGPPDRYLLTRSGRKRVWKPFEGTATIIKAQRDVCAALGCAFWDKRERMGGYGAMRQWAYAGWAQADHTHFTASGYRELANALFSDIMQRYEIYKKNCCTTNGSDSNGERAANP